MIKAISPLLFAMLFFSALQANPVDVATAKSLGVSFMKTNAAVKADVAELTYTACADNGQAAFYVFAVQPKGFVIVSADDRAKPILGYSTESNFTAQLPDGLKTFFDNYTAGFSQMFATNTNRTAEAIADWSSLAETGRLSSRKTNRKVEPLLSSIWNQTDLYNNMAPEDPNSVYSGHCKSGCVANAMSQIMRYWEWPRSGTGSHGYNAYSSYGNYGWQEASFEEATYRFEWMPDFLDFASPQAEVDAIALLEKHAGVSVDMMYGPNASGAYSEDVPDALQRYFKYSSDMSILSKDSFGHAQWNSMMRANLDEGKPFYYSSSGDFGGHAYIIDGYDMNDMFHLNWGWGGFDNGYYSIDGFYLTFYSFPYNHKAIFNLHPVDEYYNAPEAPSFYFDKSDVDNRRVSLWIQPSYHTRGGAPIEVLDSIVIMCDGEIVRSFSHISQEELQYRYEADKNGTYYFTVYSVNSAGMSKVARDTITLGSTCDVRFELVDNGGDGWDMSSIAILDEDGKISQRVGLWEGGSASLTVPVPSHQTAAFFWTYDNTCYSHGSLEEVSYEIYDWNGNLIVASDGYPEVGEMTNYEINCGMDCHMPIMEWGNYGWDEQLADYYCVLSWYWAGDDFLQYNIYRNDELIAVTDWGPWYLQYSDINPPVGELVYGVSVTLERDGESCESERATIVLMVTSTNEQQTHVSLYPNPASHSFTVEGNIKEIRVFDALGQLVHLSTEKIVEVNAWPRGIYFVRIVDENDFVSTMKFVKE